MEYRRFGHKLVVRMDRGEEVITQLKQLCELEQLHLAGVSAIGAVDRLTIGLFDTTLKIYHQKTFEGEYEVTSLLGNISRMKGEPYIHLHINVTDQTYQGQGGHLNEAWVSGTLEMIIDEVRGNVGRDFSEAIGLNLYSFSQKEEQ